MKGEQIPYILDFNSKQCFTCKIASYQPLYRCYVGYKPKIYNPSYGNAEWVGLTSTLHIPYVGKWHFRWDFEISEWHKFQIMSDSVRSCKVEKNPFYRSFTLPLLLQLFLLFFCCFSAAFLFALFYMLPLCFIFTLWIYKEKLSSTENSVTLGTINDKYNLDIQIEQKNKYELLKVGFISWISIHARKRNTVTVHMNVPWKATCWKEKNQKRKRKRWDKSRKEEFAVKGIFRKVKMVWSLLHLGSWEEKKRKLKEWKLRISIIAAVG